ncbi:beta-N-acetylhexosaminidase [Pelagicoccus albus]|uniref:beta-N-acetylhexosaminidase n=1 Tax=Pelagicoccus albus TaxID=415222 RepID=A0A7X1B8Y9_9BACT|nr:family 20 glycosylhydrolase [Pelagicoccus albus]MBC2606555.1 family 20 glycosylhydrolase [Pelagicoccus albus]
MLLFPAVKKIVLHDGFYRGADNFGISISHLAPKNGYTIKITEQQVAVSSYDEAAAFYAQATLNQIRQQSPDTGTLPCLEIEDWPDLKTRGYMLDISRCKVPSMQSLLELVDLLASLKYNQLQLYTEHTFAYQNHRIVWQDASPLTPDEIREIDAYCAARHIELVPNQNSFGHMERWLRHSQYQHLAESPNGFEHPIAGWKEFGSTLKPTLESAKFVDELFAELLPNFSSQNFNVGGDEPWELGQGFSKELVNNHGKTRVYLDHLLRIQNNVRKYGKRMQFWGDIIINDPQLATELGEDTTALLWGYELDHPFPEQCMAMKNAGVDFYVVPGTSTWNSIGGRLYTSLPNIDSAAFNAYQHGAVGLLLTDWGDNGHHQSSLLSIPAILQAASRSWNASNEDLDLKSASQRIPNPLSVSEYDAIIALSAIAGSFSKYLHNGSWLNKILFAKIDSLENLRGDLDLLELESARESLTGLAVDGELGLARDLLLFAAEKGISILNRQHPLPVPKELISRFRHYWLLRNRPGGLEECVAFFT